MFSATGLTAGNTGWLAPEIVKQSCAANAVEESKPADIFAFAMLVIEVFTGEPPFGALGNSAVVIRVSQGLRPVIPPAIDEMRDFLARCWNQDPMRRPGIDEVVQGWSGFLKEDWYVLPIRIAASLPNLSGLSSADPERTSISEYCTPPQTLVTDEQMSDRAQLPDFLENFELGSSPASINLSARPRTLNRIVL